jgi:predicted DCC family thiol-disulfide oxidoreductase YuxK
MNDQRYQLLHERIVLYDGECGLCDKAVQFIIPRDPEGRFRFAAQQSEVGARLLAEHGYSDPAMRTIVLLEEGRLYTRSAAALRIARRLSGAWPVLYGFIVVPQVLRDAVYGFIARNRYRWFGRADACRLPKPGEQGRFLDR